MVLRRRRWLLSRGIIDEIAYLQRILDMLLSSLPGDVAQLGERDNRTVEVRGSSPLISTMYYTTKDFETCLSRATIKAHPAAHHPPSPLRGRGYFKIALQIASTCSIVYWKYLLPNEGLKRLPA